MIHDHEIARAQQQHDDARSGVNVRDEPCPECNGKGEIGDEDCPTCESTGYVPVDDDE